MGKGFDGVPYLSPMPQVAWRGQAVSSNTLP